MAEGIKKGDVVVLKSGGPKMTVSNVDAAAMTGEQTVWVSWFDGKKAIKSTFSLEQVRLATKDDG